jgi:hypothetical protein
MASVVVVGSQCLLEHCIQAVRAAGRSIDSPDSWFGRRLVQLGDILSFSDSS